MHKYLAFPQVIILVLTLVLGACCSQEKANEAGKQLSSSSSKERNKAAMVLSGCGSKAVKFVPKLIELLYDPNIGVQSSAAFALRKIDTDEAREALDRAVERNKKK